MITRIQNFILNIFFPKFCFSCQREGNYLCQDCQATLEISENNFCLCQKPLRLPRAGKCQRCRSKKLRGLYFAVSYQNNLIQKLIRQFKYEPFIKELAKPLTSLIITHFQLVNNKPDFSGFFLVPVPLEKRKLKQRGFNQAEEIAKELSKSLGLEILNNVLIKIKETLPQVELSQEEREENVLGAFSIKNEDYNPPTTLPSFGRAPIIKNKKILLVDDVFTTGSTMEEAAKVLNEGGAKEVWGVVIARG